MANFQTIPDSNVITYKFVFIQSNPAPLDFNSATGSQSTFLFGMPAGYAVCAVKINPQVAIVGPSLATMTCSVGPNSSAAYYAPAYNIMQSAAVQITSPLLEFQTTAHDVNANFLSTGASINAASAGQVEITVQIRPLP
jgi:hypothetical protein